MFSSKRYLGSIPRVVILMSVYVALSAPLLFTQTTGPGTGKGKASRQNEVQEGAKPEPPLPAGHVKMPDKPLPPKEIGGKIMKMEEHLKSAVAAPAGAQQPKLDLPAARQAPKSAGKQQGHGGIVAVKAEASHLHLVVHVTATGQAEVIRATEVPGEVVLHNEPTGHFIYEVARGNDTLAVQAIPNPFEHRSFPAEAGPLKGHGHHIDEAKEADIVVKVPNTTLPNAASLHLRLYKIKPGGRPIEKIDAATLNALKRANGLETHFELAPEKVAPQIKKIGKKLEVQVEPPK